MTKQKKVQMQRNERLRLERVARNWRQQEVADQLGITVLTVQRWERGTQYPSAFYRAKLSALFGLNAQELGFIEEIEAGKIPNSETQEETQADDAAAEVVGIWTVPHARNPHFTGRDDLLNQLAQAFAPPSTEQSPLLQQVALTQAQTIKGLGGIGKTQTAVEYAYRAHEQGRYTHTFWISAANEEAILTSFATLAQLLLSSSTQTGNDQRKQVADMLRWLEQCPQPWLLIADNADDLSLIQPYLPHQGNGSLLLTTRASAAGSLGSSIEVESMGLLEGSHLLLQRAGRLATATDDTINEAGNIVAALGYFPLAIDQAGAYIEETGSSLQDYLQIFERRRHALLARRGRQATGYPDSVATTWSLSFERIAQLNPAATELLHLCAFMAPDAIPEELLTQGTRFWPKTLQEAVADPFSFNEMLEALLAFSFVKRLAEERVLSLHRLVQAVQLDRLSEQEQRAWAERLVHAVHAIFPDDPSDDMASWPVCSRYLEQAQACDTLIRQHHLFFPEAAELLVHTGIYLRERALYTLAEPPLKQALLIVEQQGEPDLLQVARVLNNLSLLYSKQGKYSEAEALQQRAISMLEQQLGAEHPQLATSLHNLADLYFLQNNEREAETFYQRSLRIREKLEGPEQFWAATTLSGLATLRQNQGQYAEAEQLYLQALHIQEARGAEHPRVIGILNSLAFIYIHQGKYIRAETLFQRALEVRERQMGMEHPDLAYSLIGLAETFKHQGKNAQAETAYLRALRIREQHLGVDHLHVTYPMHTLALFYSIQGRYAEAENLFLRALRIREQQAGPDRPVVSDTLRGLANLYTYQQRYTEAEPLFQRSLHIREQYFGPENPEVAQVLHDLANFHEVQDQLEEAAHLYRRALTIREQAVGPEYPMTIETRERLHAVLLLLEQTD